MPVLISQLSHRFGTNPWLFRNLEAQIKPGEVVAITGPSGSGKSTLLGIVAGWITPTEGSVDTESVTKINWVFQNPHGVPQRSAADHVALPLLAQHQTLAAADHEARQLLADFKIDNIADQPFASLSGGEAQRLMLARALASKPDLLLVDEPTAQLDQQTAREVAASLSALATRNVMVLIATHDHHIRDGCERAIDLGDYAP